MTASRSAASRDWAGGRVLFGGDVNPDQWSDDVLAEDLALMRAAGVNTATVGVFAWSSLEPEPGVFRFDWLDRAMDDIAAAGIDVILATPTASPPPWFSRLHPDALPVTSDGVRLLHGSRDTYNPSAPAYRAASRRITTALAERYRDHPALRMWHLHNEYGTVSYGPVTDVAFRAWLLRRYGDLATLNATWNTAFWSQKYWSWDDIHAPQRTQYLPNPLHALDFRRFCADALLQCLRDQVEIVRAITPDIPTTTNLILPPWNHYDQWAFAREVDVVSIDHYPDQEGLDGEAQVAFAADLARSLAGGRPWLLMEQATSLLYAADGLMRVKAPGRMRRNTFQYLARGSNGSLFFQWRAPRVGAEFFHSAMVPHPGPDSRVFREITALGAELGALAPITQAPSEHAVRASVAIVWSADAWWASETRGLPMRMDHLASLRRVHSALWRAGITADFIAPDARLDEYAVVLVPSLLALPAGDRDRFAEFVRTGGHLSVWYLGGTTDEHLHIVPGGYSGGFADILGIRVEEHLPLGADTAVSLSDGSAADSWAEVIRLHGAELVAAYADGAHAVLDRDAPAITRHRYGRGMAHYISTRLSDTDLAAHVERVVREAGVAATDPHAPPGVEVVRRHAGDQSFLFVINHSDADHVVEATSTDLFSGASISPTLTVAAGGATVVHEHANPGGRGVPV